MDKVTRLHIIFLHFRKLIRQFHKIHSVKVDEQLNHVQDTSPSKHIFLMSKAWLESEESEYIEKDSRYRVIAL